MKNIQKAILSSIICNVIISYELTLFGVLTHIISSVFFSEEKNSYLNTIKFLGSFAIGFGFRPIGAFIFSYIGDKYGRRKILLISVMISSISSTSIAFIPSFKDIGIFSSILLLFCRIVQGIAAGGETSINSIFLIEHSKNKKNLGFLGSIKPFSGALGSIICFLMIAICKKLTCENYEVWGWRILFYFCFIMGIIGFLARYMIKESLAYKYNQNRNLSNFPFLELIKNYKRVFIISIGIGIAQNAVIYSSIMFYNISIEKLIFLDIDIKNPMRIILEIIFGISAILFALLSDKIGRKNIMILILTILSFISLPYFFLLLKESYITTILILLLVNILVGASFGIYNSLICELFPTKIRCTAFSLAHNISAGIFGGFSPYICIWLIKKTEIKFLAGIYLFICTFISILSTLQVNKEDKKIDW